LWRKDGHEAAMALRADTRHGRRDRLTVNGEMQRTRLYRAHEQAELSGAIAETLAAFERKGWV
jgi:hypothetical protein